MFVVDAEREAWEQNAKSFGIDLAAIESFRHLNWQIVIIRWCFLLFWCTVLLAHEQYRCHDASSSPKPRDLYLKPWSWTSIPLVWNYGGLVACPNPVTMQADPKFSKVGSAGVKFEKDGDAHTVLDDMFLARAWFRKSRLARSEYWMGFDWKPRIEFGTKSRKMLMRGFWYVNLKKKRTSQVWRNVDHVLTFVKGREGKGIPGIVMFTGSSRGVVKASKNCMDLIGGWLLFGCWSGSKCLEHSAEPECAETQHVSFTLLFRIGSSIKLRKKCQESCFCALFGADSSFSHLQRGEWFPPSCKSTMMWKAHNLISVISLKFGENPRLSNCFDS